MTVDDPLVFSCLAMTVVLMLVAIVGATLARAILSLRRTIMSKSAELAQAVGDLTTATAAVATAFGNVSASNTPDADVSAGIAGIQSATATLTGLVTPPAPQP